MHDMGITKQKSANKESKSLYQAKNVDKNQLHEISILRLT